MSEPATRRRLSRGTVAVAVGLGILGLSAYGFLGLAGRTLGPVAFGALSVLWVLMNAVGPGIFFPFEQEVGRAVAERRAHGVGVRPVVLKAATLAGLVLVGLAVVALLLAQPLSRWLFRGDTALVGCLVLGVFGLAGEHITRGVFSGSGRFVRYGVQLGLDGGLRLAGAAVLAASGVGSATAYGLVLALAPVVTVLLTAGRIDRLLPTGPRAAWSDVTAAIGLLVAGNLLANIVINAGPVVVELLAGPDELAAAGIFTSVLVLARVPLFAFSAIQAGFLPALARMAARRDTAAFRRRLLQILGLVLAMGAVGVLGGALVGPWVVRVLFGEQFVTTGGQVALLAASSGAYMAATVLAQALVSVRGYHANVVIWAIGTVVFGALLAVPAAVTTRVGWAFLGGTVAALLTAVVAMALRLRRPLVPSGFETVPEEIGAD